MSIELVQFNDSTVTPKNDAALYDFILSHQSGIVTGCTITHLGANQLQVGAGWGVICGRMFIVAQQTVNATVAPSGSRKGRLMIEIDTEEETPIYFATQAEVTLPSLTQEDINGSGTVYQLELATYDVSTTTISNLVATSNAIANVPAHSHDIEEITLDSGDSLEYDKANNVLRILVDGCEAVQLAPVIYGTTDSPPAGTYPKGTIYIKHEV